MSSESGISSSEKLKPNSRKGSRKLKLSESIASSLGSNLNRIGGAHDLTKMLLTDDYFSDVNPRSMRRLMNVVYITGKYKLLPIYKNYENVKIIGAVINDQNTFKKHFSFRPVKYICTFCWIMCHPHSLNLLFWKYFIFEKTFSGHIVINCKS